MAAKKLFTRIFIYFSKPLRLLYSLIIYEIVNFSLFALYSLLLLSFFLYLKSVPIYVIVHVHISLLLFRYSTGTIAVRSLNRYWLFLCVESRQTILLLKLSNSKAWKLVMITSRNVSCKYSGSTSPCGL